MSLLKFVVILALSLTPPVASADTPEEAISLATLVAERPANEGRIGTMHFHLENSAGSVRTREAIMIHSEVDTTERIAIFFTAPAMIEETAFMSFNHAASDDENWLYLPATDRVRRLPTSDRGDYFLGTDLTYGDIKDNFKFGLDDWVFGTETGPNDFGEEVTYLTGHARTPEIGIEMGYGSFRARIDAESAFPVWIEYDDTDGDLLKRVEVLEIGVIGGTHTALHFSAENLQTGHKTDVKFTGMRFAPDLSDDIFDPDALAYGIPDVDG